MLIAVSQFNVEVAHGQDELTEEQILAQEKVDPQDADEDLAVLAWDSTEITGPLSEPVAGYDPKCKAFDRLPVKSSDINTGQIPIFCGFPDHEDQICCTMTHNSYIKSVYSELWPYDCQNDEFPGLDRLMCLACHPEQPKFTDRKKKVIRVCKSLLEESYGAKLDVRTDKFKKCGGWTTPDSELVPVSDNPADGYYLSSADPTLVFPNEAFSNAQEFFFDFDQAQIPFFEGYVIQAVDDFAQDGTPNVCFKAASTLLHSAAASLIVTLALLS